MMATRRYFVLLERDNRDSRWCIAFGDYTRGTVETEREDYRDHGIAAHNLRVLATGSSQVEIDAAVAALNRAPPPAAFPYWGGSATYAELHEAIACGWRI